MAGACFICDFLNPEDQGLNPLFASKQSISTVSRLLNISNVFGDPIDHRIPDAFFANDSISIGSSENPLGHHRWWPRMQFSLSSENRMRFSRGTGFSPISKKSEETPGGKIVNINTQLARLIFTKKALGGSRHSGGPRGDIWAFSFFSNQFIDAVSTVSDEFYQSYSISNLRVNQESTQEQNNYKTSPRESIHEIDGTDRAFPDLNNISSTEPNRFNLQLEPLTMTNSELLNDPIKIKPPKQIPENYMNTLKSLKSRANYISPL